MIRRRRSLAAALALALCACPGPGAGADGPAPRPGAYRGVVVWIRPSRDTMAVSFTPEWRRVAAGADTVWAFARAAAGEQRAHGRMEGDSLVWGLGAMAGDAGSAVEFAGVPEADGTVRGCLRAPRRGWAPAAPDAAAAFVLRPADGPAPSAADAPVRRCG
ncbi:MAG TPA: hypothetical protein VGC13_23895 [Longimicrobium sp.]|uniref:hypothetical protein n=1 Tax=Longimicrobium sp. TaxID=2029185 RepID=UPI002ED8E7E7